MTESLFTPPPGSSQAGNPSLPTPFWKRAPKDTPAAQSISQHPIPEPSLPHRQIQGIAKHLSIATFILMAIGSATRVMNAGLACPDWPLCYGQLLPANQMNLQVFLEWFHRLDASIVGFGTIALAGLSLWKRKQLPSWAPWLCNLALFLVVFQGLLGALTVTELLRFDIVTAHLGTALLFFCTLLSITVLLRPYQPLGTAQPLKVPSLLAVLLVYGQSLLGGVVASRWALHQCFGDSDLCLVMNSHIVGVFPAAIATLVVVVWAHRIASLSIPLRYLSRGIAGMLCLQIALGILAYKLHLQVEPLTVTHQAIGAVLLGLLLSFALLTWRDSHGLPHQPEPQDLALSQP